jgi:acyl-CoA thioester hydrolase
MGVSILYLTNQTPIRVRYAETDQMGIVYHSNYLIWFEVGRTELFREAGLPYTLFEEQGLGLAVIEASCRYRRPALYDDNLIIKTNLEEFSSRKVTFIYQVIRDNTLLAEGKTVHVFMNRDGKSIDARPYKIWQKVIEILGE